MNWLRGRRVLLVEDEYLVATQMAQRFSSLGAIVEGPFASAPDAMHAAASGKLDGAVIDINLRGDMAYELADQLQRQGVPFVFATGYDRASIPQRFANVVHCEKPVDPLRVAQALGAIL